MHRRLPQEFPVRNMRCTGVSQVVRIRITGRRTDSTERHYNIADVEDLKAAKALIAKL